MAKKKGRGKKSSSRRPKIEEEDDFDPLANAVIDDEFALPVSGKKKKQGKSKSAAAEPAPAPAAEGPLGTLKGKASLYKIESKSVEILSEEGLEDDDLADLGQEDLVEMGLSEEQAKKVVSAVRGDPVEGDNSALQKLRGTAESYGILEESFTLLEEEGLADEDLEDLGQEDLMEMGLSADQAQRIVSAVNGSSPPSGTGSQKLSLLKAKAGEFKIDEKTIQTLEAEGFEEDDLFDLDKDDYKGIGLKLGQILRLMKAVKEIQSEKAAGRQLENEDETTPTEPNIETKEKKESTKKVSKKSSSKSSKKGSKKTSKKEVNEGESKGDNDDPFADFIQEKPREEKLSKAQLKRRRQKEAAARGEKDKEEESKEEMPTDPSKMSKKQRKKYLKRLKEEEEAKKRAEALKRLKDEQERLIREEEEKKKKEKERIEEEKRKAEEEARRKEEERIRKKEEKKRKRQEMKKAGLILTKKQKEEKRRLEQARKRLGQMGVAPNEGGQASTGSSKRNSGRDRRRGGNKPKSKKLQAIADAEAAKRKAEEEAAAAAAENAKQKEEDDAAEDWEADDGEEAMDWEAAAEVDSEEEREKERAKKEEEEKKKKEAEEAERRKAEEEAKKAEDEERKRLEEDEKSSGRKGKKGKGKKGKKPKDTRELRSPICCILGHVDTGKTKLLDKMRSTNVQDREAGGITQQIGATYFPMSNIEKATTELVASTGKNLNAKLPGLLMIDTPGHESFTNLRARGSNLCDIAILVVDLMHGLEPQTLESIRLLKERKTPFVVALNKVDRLFEWDSIPNGPIRDSLKKQKPHVKQEFESRCNQAIAEFAKEAELNTVLYYKNKDPKEWVSLVPTSAHTGEGIPDLLWLLVKMTQNFMRDKIAVSYTDLQCTVLEVKKVEGLGTTIDVVLVNGILHEGDTIVVCGLQGPIVTTIRALLTPPPMKEIRVKSEYVHHKEIKAAMGVKITANGLENAVAGTQLLVCGPNDDIEDLKDDSMADLASILSRIDPSGQGVYVQASTLGSLEALLQFLEDMKVPVSGLAIGPVHKKDVMKAAVMREHREEYAVILAFDVQANAEAKQMANEMGVTIFTADIIYHLFDMVTKYFEDVRAKRRAEAAPRAVFPCILKILPEFIFNKRSPIVVGVEIVEGILRKGTPLCIPDKKPILDIGAVTSIEFEHKEKNEAKKGEQVCIKIEQNRGNQIILLGRHFDISQNMVSRLSRESIKLLKENFKEELDKDDWKLVVKLKKVFEIYGSSN